MMCNIDSWCGELPYDPPSSYPIATWPYTALVGKWQFPKSEKLLKLKGKWKRIHKMWEKTILANEYLLDVGLTTIRHKLKDPK